jgi:hypothetical protein
MKPGKTVKPIILLLAFILVVHVWVIRGGGGWWPWPGQTAFYSHLSDGFLHGRLSLPDKPSPALLKLADPYNPYFTYGLRLHDAVLYEGKYYVYWGPAPALVIIPFCLAFGQTHPRFGDQYVAFVLAFGLVVLAAALLLKIQKKYFATQQFTALAAIVLSLALGTPLLFSLYRAAVYEAAILGGQLFLLAGIWSAWVGVRRDERRSVPLLLAGIFWTFSVGSRVSLAPAIAVSCIVTIVQIRGSSRKRPFAGAAILLTPLLIGAALFAWYNYARFHSVTEFGLRYQLAAANQNKMPASDFCSPRFIIANLLNYLFSAPVRWGKFPYLRASTPRWTAAMFHLGIKYRVEPVVGICWTQPLLILSLASLAWRPPDASGRWLRRVLWAAVIFGFLPPLMMDGGTMRYLMDMVPCCTILAAIGFWRLMELAENSPRVREYVELAVGLMVMVQSAVGLLLTS